MCRLRALIALTCLLLAVCEASQIASQRVANTELASLSLRTDHPPESTLFEKGKILRLDDTCHHSLDASSCSPQNVRLSQRPGSSLTSVTIASVAKRADASPVTERLSVPLTARLQSLHHRATSDKPASSIQSTNRALLSASSSGLGAQGPLTADGDRSPISTIPPLSPIRTRLMGSTSGVSSVNTHNPASGLVGGPSPPVSNTHGSTTSGSELRKPWPRQGPRKIGKSALDDDADSHDAKVEFKRLFPKKPSKLKRHSYALRKTRRRTKIMKRPGSFKASRFANSLLTISSDDRESIDARFVPSYHSLGELSTHSEHGQGHKRMRSTSTADLWSLSSMSSALGSDDEREVGDSHNSGWQHFANEPSATDEHYQGLKRIRPASTADIWSLSSLNSAGASDESPLAGQQPKKRPKGAITRSPSLTSLATELPEVGRHSSERKLGRLKGYRASLSKISGGVKKPPLKMHRIFAHGMLRRALSDEGKQQDEETAGHALAARYAKHPVKYLKMLWKAEAKRKSPVKDIRRVQRKTITKKKGSNAVIVGPTLPLSRLMPLTKQGRPRKPFQSYRARLEKLHKERNKPNSKKRHAQLNLLAKQLKIWRRRDVKAQPKLLSGLQLIEPAPPEISPYKAAGPVALWRRDVADEVRVMSTLVPRVAQSGWKYVANAINKHRRRRRPLHRVRDKKITKSRGPSMLITGPNLPYSRLAPITKQQWPKKPFQSYRASLDRLRKTRAKQTEEWMSFLQPSSGDAGKQKKSMFLDSGTFIAKPTQKPDLIPFAAGGIAQSSSKMGMPTGGLSDVVSGVMGKGKEVMIPAPRRNPPRKARPDRYSRLGKEQGGTMSSTLVG